MHAAPIKNKTRWLGCVLLTEIPKTTTKRDKTNRVK